MSSRARALAYALFVFALQLSLGAALPAWAAGSMPGTLRLESYLPPQTELDPAIPTPASVLGWEVGEWHVRHDQLVRYLEVLDQSSDRMVLTTIGFTHEQRPLLNLVISAPENLARLEAIRATHQQLSDGTGAELDLEPLPAVVYLGHSIHGNEPSGANAALLTAYYLAAARGPVVEEWLRRLVIVLDPSLNPDGLARFAQWANQFRGKVLNPDPLHREHVEPWPNGRTNHYFFDLNRDWLPAVHPETQARLRAFHAWRPNVLTDFHEMGTDGTYFFQPGIPSRQNPMTPKTNVVLTQRIAAYHAKALDRLGSLYYTEESFDDYYYGKGSTYPDIQGSVGILFEQASSRGHVQDSLNGPVTFPFTIRNQFTTALSTLEAVVAMRRDLLEEQRRFYADAAQEAQKSRDRALVFGASGDPARAFLLAQLLRRHRIVVHPLAERLTVDEKTFVPGEAYVVRLQQPQYRLIRALFEETKEFPDNSFYDVSAWALHRAYGVELAPLSLQTWRESLAGAPLAAADELELPAGRFSPHPDAVAYGFSWSGYFAPRAATRLLRAGLVLRGAQAPLSFDLPGGSRATLPTGSALLAVAGQKLDRAALENLLAEVARVDGIDILPLTSGLTAAGIDLGSPRLRPLKLPRPALLIGGGFEPYAIGEVWHLLDQRFGLDVTLLQKSDLGRANLERYTHLIVVGGTNDPLSKADNEQITRWVRGGGTLLSLGPAVAWAEQAILRPPAETAGAAPGSGEDAPKLERRAYEDFDRDFAERLIAGAIFETELDLSHPLAFGLGSPRLATFRDHETLMSPPPDPYATLAAYSSQPRIAGFISEGNLRKLAGSPAVVAERLGKGLVVRYADNPNFRGFWYGGSKLFLNGLLLQPLVDTTRALDRTEE